MTKKATPILGTRKGRSAPGSRLLGIGCKVCGWHGYSSRGWLAQSIPTCCGQPLTLDKPELMDTFQRAEVARGQCKRKDVFEHPTLGSFKVEGDKIVKVQQ